MRSHNIIAVMDSETSGLVANYHKIMSLAILPVTRSFKIDTSIEPFDCRFKVPRELCEAKALEVNGLNPDEGESEEEVLDMLVKWFNKFNIRKIYPLGMNVGFDIGFIEAWLTDCNRLYDNFFHFYKRDVMTLALAYNDQARVKFYRKLPFSRGVSLQKIAEGLDIDYIGAHNAMNDCHITLQAYNELLSRFSL